MSAAQKTSQKATVKKQILIDPYRDHALLPAGLYRQGEARLIFGSAWIF
jgi:hypothetical protein